MVFLRRFPLMREHTRTVPEIPLGAAMRTRHAREIANCHVDVIVVMANCMRQRIAVGQCDRSQIETCEPNNSAGER
jgi:hypothetical protein